MSLQMETQVCSTKAKITPKKAKIPVLENLCFWRWGDPWEDKVTLSLSSTLYNNILHNSITCTILAVICQMRKIQTRTAPKDPHDGNQRPFHKVIQGLQGIFTRCLYMHFFFKKRLVKAKIFENWNLSFFGGYLSFRGTNLIFHFQ